MRTKVVMVSAYNLFEYAQTAIRHGAYDYLLKPVDAEKVEALLRRLEQQLAAETKERGSPTDEAKAATCFSGVPEPPAALVAERRAAAGRTGGAGRLGAAAGGDTLDADGNRPDDGESGR